MVSEENLQILCKDKLKARIFLGRYEEKRYISEIGDYRSVIYLSPSELELATVLQDVQRRIKKFYKDTPMWFGFSLEDAPGNMAGTLFIDELEDVPFGHFWFQIKSVKFTDDEVKLKLKSLRAVEETDFNCSSPSSSKNYSGKIDSSASTNQSSGSISESIAWKDIPAKWADEISTELKGFFYHKVNKEGFKNLIQFLVFLITMLLLLAVQFVKYVGIFSIRFMEEFRKLIHVCTPLFFGVLDLISRIIGGFFIFLTMLWKDSTGGRSHQTNVQNPLLNAPRMQALPYKPVYNRQPNYTSFRKNQNARQN